MPLTVAQDQYAAQAQLRALQDLVGTMPIAGKLCIGEGFHCSDKGAGTGIEEALFHTVSQRRQRVADILGGIARYVRDGAKPDHLGRLANEARVRDLTPDDLCRLTGKDATFQHEIHGDLTIASYPRDYGNKTWYRLELRPNEGPPMSARHAMQFTAKGGNACWRELSTFGSGSYDLRHEKNDLTRRKIINTLFQCVARDAQRLGADRVTVENVAAPHMRDVCTNLGFKQDGENAEWYSIAPDELLHSSAKQLNKFGWQPGTQPDAVP